MLARCLAVVAVLLQAQAQLTAEIFNPGTILLAHMPDYGSMTVGATRTLSQVLWEKQDLADLVLEGERITVDGSALVNDFALRYTGDLVVEVSGWHTFYLTSDDGSVLLIDGGDVVDNGHPHFPRERWAAVNLAQGRHAFELRYFQRDLGASLKLEWQTPAAGRQVIPAANLVPRVAATPTPPATPTPASPTCSCNGVGPDAPGLEGIFWQNSLTTGLQVLPDLSPNSALRQSTDGRFKRVVANLNQAQTGSAWPDVPSSFTVDYVDVHVGFLQVPVSGSYRLHITSNDGSRLLLGGAVIADNDGAHGMEEVGSSVLSLDAGLVEIEVQHFQGINTAGLVLQWTKTDGVKEVVPAGNLAHCNCDVLTPVPPPTPVPLPPRECTTPYPNSAGADGICVQSIAGNFGKPRMMAVEKVEGRTAILVVDALESTVVHLMDVNGDGKIEGAHERKVLVQTDQNDVVKKLSHGIAVVGDYVFATSAHQLYRWEYNRGARELSKQVTLVDGISDHPLSEGGSEETKWGHVTRTLAVNADTMFISVRSAFNVDANEFRSALRKVPLATLLQPASAFATPLQFIDLALVANGLRNEVGLAFDSAGVLWGVENGADNAYHKELGGDVHNDNPSEEVNKFDITKERLFYGYPYCWSEFRLPDAARATYGHQPGRQWVWERTLGSADAGFADTHNDTFCRDTSKVVAPHYSFQAHMAPLGITFLKDECELSPDAFPCAWKGKAFVAFHGSWNRNPAVGYKVVMLDMEAKTEVDIFTSETAASGGAAPFVQGTRPVDVQFDPVSGVMYLTQDGVRGQGEVLVIRYIGAWR